MERTFEMVPTIKSKPKILCQWKDCQKFANYGLKGGKKKHCYIHKPKEAIYIKKKQCFNGLCIRTARYGINKPTHCKIHASIDAQFFPRRRRLCLSCNLTQSSKKYDYYCTSCFAFNFPEDSRVHNIRRKSKELRVRDFLNQHYPGFINDKSINFGDCDCNHRRRVDFRKLINNTMLAIEVDENQHKRYHTKDEHDRYNDLFMAYSGKWIFIRFNPDKFRDCAGILTDPTQSQRLKCLQIEIDHQIERILKNHNENMLEIIHLFYDHNSHTSSV